MNQLPLFDAGEPLEDLPHVPRRAGWDRTARPFGKGRPCTPADPGSGPPGERCGNCALLERIAAGGRTYLKCGAMRSHWTRGAGTDVRARWPACALWRPLRGARRIRLVRATLALGPRELLAEVYQRPRERTTEPDPFGELDSLGGVWVWFDWHVENCWRPLRPPGYWTGSAWRVIH